MSDEKDESKPTEIPKCWLHLCPEPCFICLQQSYNEMAKLILDTMWNY